MSKEKDTTEKTFEVSMAELEQIVRRLEESDVPLEEAIALFQDGMNLSKLCHQRLQKVEDKIDQIIEENGEMKPFTIQEDDMA